MLENRVLKLLESGPRLDAELFDERLRCAAWYADSASA